MKPARLTIIHSGLLAGMLITPALQADSLTIKFPLDLRNIHGEVNKLSTTCFVMYNNQIVKRKAAVTGLPGQDTRQVRRNMSLKIDFDTPLAPCRTYTYKCQFLFSHYTSSNFVPPLSASSATADIWKTRKPQSTPFITEFSGKFEASCPDRVVSNMRGLKMTGQGE